MKKVLSLVLAITMLISSMAITVNATDDQTITLDGDMVESSVITCTGTLTIEGKGSLKCPGINATNVVFKSGYIQIDGQLIAETINLNGAVVNVNTTAETAVDGNINANAGVMIANTSSKSPNVNVFDTSNSITINNSMHYWIENNVFKQKDVTTIDLKKESVTQMIIAKNILYAIDSSITQNEFDSTYIYLNNVYSPFTPTFSTFTNGNLFYCGTGNPGIKIDESISGSGTIVGYSKSGTAGLELLDNSYVNEDFCLVSCGTDGIKTIYPESNTPSSTPTDLPDETPTNKNFTLVGEIINQTKNSVTIGYKIVNNDGIYEIMLKPIFDEQNIEVFVDKNALGSSWSNVLSKEGYAYELYCNDASTKTNTNLAIISYTNIQPEDTFGLEYSYTPDDSGSITTNTNEITIQALTHQAVFHFMYNGSEIKTVTHTDVEIETTLTDLSELENNIHWFKQSRWYSDSGFTTAITYMPNNDIDVYCNYEFNVKTGDIDGNGIVSADDLTLLRRYRISDTDNFVFINDEDDAFNTYDENKHYIFLCCANVNNLADNKIDGSDVLALSWAIFSGKEGSLDYSYMLSADESSVIKRQ